MSSNNTDIQIIDLVTQPTLKSMSFNAIACALWMSKDIRPLLMNYPCNFSTDAKFWVPIKYKVRENARALAIPDEMQEKLAVVVIYIGKEIHNWLNREGFGFTQASIMDIDYVKTHLHFLHWTPYGTLNLVETMREVVRDPSLRPEDRFRLACDYCLSDEVAELWPHVKPPQAAMLPNVEDYIRRLNSKPVTVRFWTFRMAKIPETFFHDQLRRHNPNASPYLVMFTVSLENGTLQAMQYFWTFLNRDEKLVFMSDELPRITTLNTTVPSKWFFLFKQYPLDKALDLFSQQPETFLKRILSCPNPFWTPIKALLKFSWMSGRMAYEDYVQSLLFVAREMNEAFGLCRKLVYSEIYFYLMNNAPKPFLEQVMADVPFCSRLEGMIQSGHLIRATPNSDERILTQYLNRNTYS